MTLRLSKTILDIQWSFISIGVSSIAHFLLRIIVGNSLGSSGLGIYTLTFTIYMFGMQFAAFGFGAALTRYVAEANNDYDKINKHISSGLFGAIISGILTGIILFSLAPYISNNFFHMPELTQLLKITAFCFPFISLYKIAIGSLNGYRRMKEYSFIMILLNVFTLITTTILVLTYNYGLKGAVVGYVLPTIIVGILCIIFIYHDSKISLPYYFNMKLLSSFGIFVVLTNSVGIINTQIDSILIGRFMSSSEVGIYSVAILFMHGLLLLPQAIQRVTSPIISSYYGRMEIEAIDNTVKKVTKKTVILTIVIAVIIAIFGRRMILILFSNDFISAYTPMIMLTIGYTIYSSMVCVGSCLSNIGKIKTQFRNSVACAAINTILNLILIPTYGIYGAAFATSMALIITTIIFHTTLYFSLKEFIVN